MRIVRWMILSFTLIVLVRTAEAQAKKHSAAPLPVPMDSVRQDADYLALATYRSKQKVDERLVQNIDSTCAVLIYPDQDQLEQLKQEGEEAYDVTVDDGMYYQGTAIEVLNSLHLRTVTAEKRFLRFKGRQQWLLDIRKKNLPYWNLILFAVTGEPKIVQGATLERDSVAAYFNIKTE